MLRNATTRLIALHLALVGVAIVLVLGFVYWRTAQVIDIETREIIETELRGLADDFAQGGLPGLAAAVDRRLGPAGERDAVYLLADSRGSRLVGNLAGWPPTVTPRGGPEVIDLFRLDRNRPTRIVAVGLVLPGNVRLLVGRDVQARALFDQTLAEALAWAFGGLVLLTAGSGWLLSRLVGRRIAEVADTAEAIMAGALDRRVPVRGRGDEFDRLAATLNAMLDRIARLVGELRMVTDSLAHDLGSPLARLKNNLDMADAEGISEAERRERLGRAQAEADRILTTATALLEIARAEAGAGADQFAEVDLGQLARDIGELFEAAAEEKGLRLFTEAAPGLTVRGHRQLLAQAISNLIDNALKYGPKDTVITLEAANEAGAPFLRVADQGPGVPEADRLRILERFMRLDQSRGAPGAGLGLAMVAAVAKLHGASIEIGDNRPGLMVTLRFPAATR
ncbi:MAG TPA: HAMP domain-containing sensor histidine kinase [Paracoccaceae bacterium]|nr:HAMP domain-containing sensor histidine kinase [Paracoccaceae bacterium]